MEQCKEFQTPLFVNYVDFKKAFDSIHSESLWKVLKLYGIPDKFINIFKSLYHHSNCCVKTRDGLTSLFDVITGMHQGCILSLLLFLICIDYVMRKALNHPEFGIPWGRGKLTDLDFADDVALLSHSATTLQQMTDSLKTSAEMVGLRITSDKTKVSTVSATDTPILIGQQTLEGVSEFQYLGSIISTNSDVEVDIRARIGKATSTFQRLRKIWSSHSINLDTKLRLYTSIVIPTALHAC